MALASAARANGRFPATQQLVVMPGNPKQLMVRATFGLLLSSDQGANWDWVCEGAVGYGNGGAQEDPGVAMTSSGAALVAAFEGLSVSPDTGCSWHFVEGALQGLFFVDVAVSPSNPHTAVALASTFNGEGGAQSYNVQLFQTTDDGATWAPYGDPLNPLFQGDTVELAASDPHRVYVTGEYAPLGSTDGGPDAGPALHAALFTSTTDGTNWVQNAVPLLPTNEEAAFIAAVDPTNADIVYLRTGDHTGLQPSRLLVTSNAGTSFTQRFAGKGAMLGFALAADGSEVYLGGEKDGLQTAATSDFVFTQRSSVLVQCLTLSGSTLYACSSDPSGFIVGASSDQGTTFQPLLHLCSVRGPLACPSGTATQMDCPIVWTQTNGIEMQVGAPCSTPDGGHDAGAASSPPSPPPKRTGCGGCAASPSTAGGIGVAFLATFAFFMRRSRARKNVRS
jgi:hypothetical protein